MFFAILLRRDGIDNAPIFVKKYAIKNGKILDRIRFEMLNLGMQQGEDMKQEDEEFYYSNLKERALKRKEIVKKEIGRVVNKAHLINLKNSHYYRELLSIVTKFNDLTLIDWFIPIKLTFDKFVHIYVKHVEETKFGEKDQQKRSFFDYKHSEILTLLKSILRQEEEDIKVHFAEISVAFEMKQFNKMKDYHRGFKNFSKLVYDGNEFILSIDKKGFIQSFFQVKRV